jgi:hypothetical protein
VDLRWRRTDRVCVVHIARCRALNRPSGHVAHGSWIHNTASLSMNYTIYYKLPNSTRTHALLSNPIA